MSAATPPPAETESPAPRLGRTAARGTGGGRLSVARGTVLRPLVRRFVDPSAHLHFSSMDRSSDICYGCPQPLNRTHNPCENERGERGETDDDHRSRRRRL